VAAVIGCTVGELGERMTSEEFAWWTVMMQQDWIGPHRQAELLAHVVAGVRNGPLKGPRGEKSLWDAKDLMPAERWQPPVVMTPARMKQAVRAWFSKMAGKKR
jgi:hypothetical protein